MPTAPRAFYNEIDSYCAEWLRNLIDGGHIAPGVVDTRSIVDIRPSDLDGFTQCHFFAGIGGWSLAARQAGWSDDQPLWTGSCPCQPFSSAGKGGGFDDKRHLWPHFHYLVSQCRPSVVLGEQVASKDGLAWLDLVQSDMEGTGYAVGSLDLCAAGIGAPHIRQRLWWVGLADADHSGSQGRFGMPQRPDQCAIGPRGLVGVEGSRASATPVRWDACDWLLCRDGRWRPVMPESFPLVDGLSFKLGSGSPFEGKSRVGMLGGYGNAIVPPLAAEFIACVREIVDNPR